MGLAGTKRRKCLFKLSEVHFSLVKDVDHEIHNVAACVCSSRYRSGHLVVPNYILHYSMDHYFTFLLSDLRFSKKRKQRLSTGGSQALASFAMHEEIPQGTNHHESHLATRDPPRSPPPKETRIRSIPGFEAIHRAIYVNIGVIVHGVDLM